MVGLVRIREAHDVFRPDDLPHEQRRGRVVELLADLFADLHPVAADGPLHGVGHIDDFDLAFQILGQLPPAVAGRLSGRDHDVGFDRRRGRRSVTRRRVAEERPLIGIHPVGPGAVEPFRELVDLVNELIDPALLPAVRRQQFADDPLQQGRVVRQVIGIRGGVRHDR